MVSITESIRKLKALPLAGRHAPQSVGPSRLRPLAGFGSNPGALNAWSYVPEGADGMALVVVLHGCTQTAAGYDHGSGWSQLAERHGFALLYPEQQRANNPNLCFNWFQDEDTRRDGGEALSIRQMIATMVERHPIDPDRIFVTGLSAGGAMTSVMLATYPELFAGGSIIAGLPYGSASSVQQALERMRGAGHADEAGYATKVRGASPHGGRWPRVTVWHGDADRTVDVVNADAIIGQWRVLHGAPRAPHVSDVVDGHRHRVWLAADGGDAVEEFRIAGMGHGTPLRTAGPEGCGAAGAHMLEAGISSTRRQAAIWGLLDGAAKPVAIPAPTLVPADPAPAPAAEAKPATGVQAVIENALRTAGLMP